MRSWRLLLFGVLVLALAAVSRWAGSGPAAADNFVNGANRGTRIAGSIAIPIAVIIIAVGLIQWTSD